MTPARRTFDYLHAELTMFCGVEIKRFAVWQELEDPNNLTPELAADFLETPTARELSPIHKPHRDLDGDWRRMVGRVRNFNPDKETPEETMERLCGGRE